ncbi:hypothetical protein ABZ353_02265 [Streptomyces niveus]|uniref:hypothetical protein n=1 Tax=Streptomyces niveus TaxID=193462 RepID=UPI00340E682D
MITHSANLLRGELWLREVESAAWTARHPEITEGPPEAIPCDEFPFSTTYQSPGFAEPTFIKTFRVLDGDAYTLDPGNAWFKACDPSKAALLCTMAKPWQAILDGPRPDPGRDRSGQ